MGWSPDRLRAVVNELEVVAQARGIDTKKNPPLVVLDFLQLVGDPDTADRSLPVRERIQHAAYQARDVARRHGAVVLAVSSTSRENAARLRRSPDDPLPYPDELVGTGKESGEIEYSADGVLVMVKHSTDGDLPSAGWPVSVAVAKLRAGRTGWLHTRFNGHRHTPADHERDELEAKPTKVKKETPAKHAPNTGEI